MVMVFVLRWRIWSMSSSQNLAPSSSSSMMAPYAPRRNRSSISFFESCCCTVWEERQINNDQSMLCTQWYKNYTLLFIIKPKAQTTWCTTQTHWLHYDSQSIRSAVHNSDSCFICKYNQPGQMWELCEKYRLIIVRGHRPQIRIHLRSSHTVDTHPHNEISL